MRIPAALCTKRNARAPQQVHTVAFQEILPLRLKNTVSGKSESTTDVACLQEMAIVFACLKNNDFTEKLCNKEIEKFQKCYQFFLTKKYETKTTENQGIITPGKNLNYKQLNKYMRLYPNPV